MKIATILSIIGLIMSPVVGLAQTSETQNSTSAGSTSTQTITPAQHFIAVMGAVIMVKHQPLVKKIVINQQP